jgi:hypothetical protein
MSNFQVLPANELQKGDYDIRYAADMADGEPGLMGETNEQCEHHWQLSSGQPKCFLNRLEYQETETTRK